jgi:hypothetical protein
MISFRKLVILPESGRPVTRKTRVKTDDPMRATEGGETQAAAAAAATSTTEATEEEEEEEAATPLIIICSVPSRYYYYTHYHHNRRARDFLVSQFRWLLPMRAKHGKQPIWKIAPTTKLFAGSEQHFTPTTTNDKNKNRNKGNNKQNKTKQNKQKAGRVI